MIRRPRIVAGAFRLAIDNPAPLLRIVERCANARAQHLQLPWGDQAIFLRAEQFHQIGGFRDWPAMEDLEMVLRLRRIGHIALAPDCVTTSARRWKTRGVIRTTLRNQLAILAWSLGIPPHRIVRLRG